MKVLELKKVREILMKVEVMQGKMWVDHRNI